MYCIALKSLCSHSRRRCIVPGLDRVLEQSRAGSGSPEQAQAVSSRLRQPRAGSGSLEQAQAVSSRLRQFRAGSDRLEQARARPCSAGLRLLRPQTNPRAWLPRARQPAETFSGREKGVKNIHSNIEFFGPPKALSKLLRFFNVPVEFTVIKCERRRREQTFLDSLLPIPERGDGISAASCELYTCLAKLHSANDSSARRCGLPNREAHRLTCSLV